MKTTRVEKEMFALKMLEVHHNYDSLHVWFQTEWMQYFGLKDTDTAHRHINKVMKNLYEKWMVGRQKIPYKTRSYTSYYIPAY